MGLDHSLNGAQPYRLASLDDLREGNRATSEGQNRTTVGTSSEEADRSEPDPITQSELWGLADIRDPQRNIDENHADLQKAKTRIKY